MGNGETPALETVPFEGPVSVAIREFDLEAFDRPWHRHPEAELTLILEGGGLRYVGDSVEPFAAGDFCLLGGHLPHAWLSTHQTRSGRARSWVVQIDLLRWRELLQLPEMASAARLLSEAARGLRFPPEMGHRLRDRVEGEAPGLRRLIVLLEALDDLSRCAEARPISIESWSRSSGTENDPRLSTVLAYLGRNFGESIDQAEVARMAGLSPAAFSRFFKRTMGKTFQNYVSDLRLGIAGRQLLESERTVSEIAFAAGFGNLSNFNRRFRERHQMAPRDYRRLGR